MSWDVWLVADLGNGEVRVTDLEQNYTHNTNGMIREAGAPCPSDWEGMRAGELALELSFAIRAMRGDVERFDKMNPPNGWGSRETLCAALDNVIKHCVAAPNAIVRTSV